jgi:hypothetical protein
MKKLIIIALVLLSNLVSAQVVSKCVGVTYCDLKSEKCISDSTYKCIITINEDNSNPEYPSIEITQLVKDSILITYQVTSFISGGKNGSISFNITDVKTDIQYTLVQGHENIIIYSIEQGFSMSYLIKR